MVSPNLIKKKEKSLSLTLSAKRLFQLIYIKKNGLEKNTKDSSNNIVVSSMTSKLTLVYEKIRNAVDYDDDHLLRKNAIKRIFKRHMIIEGLLKKAKSEEMALHLMTELIQAGYLENNKILESKIQEVANIFEKYIKLEDLLQEKDNFFHLFFNFNKEKSRKRTQKAQKKLFKLITSLAASEIEMNLTRDNVQQEIVLDMFEILRDTIRLPKNLPYDEDLDIQTYLAVVRNYLNYDDDLLTFAIFKYYNNRWSHDDLKTEEIEDIASKIDVIYASIQEQLKHPLKRQLDKVTKSYSLYFSILEETIWENPMRIYDQASNNYKAFINTIKENCEKGFAKIKKKLWRSGFRSIIYIFLTKSIFVFLLEVPAVKFFGEEINLLTLAINISFPAVLLFLMILFTWTPAQENTKKIISGVEEIVFNEKRKAKSILLKKPAKRTLAMDISFTILYFGGFSLTIYFIVKFLTFLGFNWVSIIIFLFFLTFASFFSFRIKRDIKKFIIIEPKEGFFSFILDFFYTPIVATGKFLSDNASRINIFVFILDFIIEAPFRVFVDVFDSWLRYVKERKENLIS